MDKSAAPEWSISKWLNTRTPITLLGLRGQVVVLKAFQMLCPGCVSHALPQALRIRQNFKTEDVAVIGLHSVFEHREAQGSEAALIAFLHEYRIGFPVGIDKPSVKSRLPMTMSEYKMQGTPTTLLFDKEGCLRHHIFGQVDDMALGAEIMALKLEQLNSDVNAPTASKGVCSQEGCEFSFLPHSQAIRAR